jgi:hypothetical protein
MLLYLLLVEKGEINLSKHWQLTTDKLNVVLASWNVNLGENVTSSPPTRQKD